MNEGRTARFLLDTLLQIDRYVGIDVLPGRFERTDQASEVPQQPARYAKADPRTELVLRARRSFDVAPGEVGMFDVVFIDGDHGRDAVLHDTQLAMAVLQLGGLLV